MYLIGKTLILLGVILMVIGVLFTLGPKIPWLGRLPGDIYIQKKNASFYFPIATCILLSVILTCLMYLFRKR